MGNEMQSNTSALVLNAGSFDSIMRFASVMASGVSTIPKHLQGNVSDCTAVVMQAMQWGMNPYAVAQKTHVTQGGVLGYEAQLINAVICANAPVIEESPSYEFIGDWSKVLGKVEERKSDKGGKYYVATYTKSDEFGLGVIVRMTIRGEELPREITVMLSQCYPRFSTQWATDPKQQICYVGIRKWGRLFTPGVIMGVYTPDELEEFSGEARVVNPVPVAMPSAISGDTTHQDNPVSLSITPKMVENIKAGLEKYDITEADLCGHLAIDCIESLDKARYGEVKVFFEAVQKLRLANA